MDQSALNRHKSIVEEEQQLASPLRAKRLGLEKDLEFARIRRERELAIDLVNEIKKLDREIEVLHRALGLRPKTKSWEEHLN